MIERKNVKHDIPEVGSPYAGEIFSWVYVTEISSSVSGNSEAIRRKLYGDVVDELAGLRRALPGLTLQGIDVRLGQLIDKLEWKDGQPS